MGKLLVLRFRENEHEDHRFSVIISHRISTKAVPRNRVKRQIHEVIRLNADKFPKKPHFDILVLPKKNILGATYEDIEADILAALKKLPS